LASSFRRFVINAEAQFLYLVSG